MGRVISICNQKGGVGKTTTAVNLATSMALANKKTLLIDFDPQANATSGAGIDKNSVSQSTYTALLGRAQPEEVVIPTQVDNLSLMPSNLHLTGAEVELVGIGGREYKLQAVIGPLRDSFDYILVDSPPSLGLLTINALVASDTTLIPIQCEYYALEGLSQLLHTIDLVKKNLNPKLEIEGVLLTMADYRTNLAHEVTEEVRSFFKEKTYQTVIPRSIRLSEAPGFGKPIVLYDRSSIGAQKYFELSREIFGRDGCPQREKSNEATT